MKDLEKPLLGDIEPKSRLFSNEYIEDSAIRLKYKKVSDDQIKIDIANVVNNASTNSTEMSTFAGSSDVAKDEKFVEVNFTPFFQRFASVKGFPPSIDHTILEDEFCKLHDTQSLLWIQLFSATVGFMSSCVGFTYTASSFEGIGVQALVPAVYFCVGGVLLVFSFGVWKARHRVLAVDEALVLLEDGNREFANKVKHLLPEEIYNLIKESLETGEGAGGSQSNSISLMGFKHPAITTLEKSKQDFLEKSWIMSGTRKLFLAMVFCIVLVLAVFPYSYQWWLRGKGKRHLVYAVKANAILRFLHVVVPMMLCITTQGLYFSDLVFIVIPFTSVTFFMLTTFYTETFLEKGIADDYECGDPFDCETAENSEGCSYEDSYPVYLALWQNQFFAGFGLLFAAVALLNRRTSEYQTRKSFVQNVLLKLRIVADDDIFKQQKAAAHSPFDPKNLKIAYTLEARGGGGTTLEQPGIVKEGQFRFCYKKKTNLNGEKINDKIKLGKGAAGTVYKGEYDVKFFKDVSCEPTMVALKEFKKKPGLFDEVCREANALHQQHHDNIVHFYGVGVREGSVYYIMELMEGSLYQATHESKFKHYKVWRKNPVLFYQVVLGIVIGMDAAHRRKLAHGDLKPGNILVSEDFSVKISDFGFARLSKVEDDAELTGTSSYMAPELLTYNKETVNYLAADVYSFGIMLWEMYAQQKPYEGRHFINCTELTKQVKFSEMRPDNWRSFEETNRTDPIPSCTTGSVEVPLLRVIRRCWSQNPNDRPSFSKLKEEIKGNPDLFRFDVTETRSNPELGRSFSLE